MRNSIKRHISLGAETEISVGIPVYWPIIETMMVARPKFNMGYLYTISLDPNTGFECLCIFKMVILDLFGWNFLDEVLVVVRPINLLFICTGLPHLVLSLTSSIDLGWIKKQAWSSTFDCEVGWDGDARIVEVGQKSYLLCLCPISILPLLASKFFWRDETLWFF